MRYYAYIIRSIREGTFYIGSCEDVVVRLARHNAGKVKSTKSRRPYELVLVEEFLTRAEAYRRERQIKSYKNGEAFKRLIKKD
jgi:putative endonuclease